MYGTQAGPRISINLRRFENDVNMYGTQAISGDCVMIGEFENDVNMYGTQAYSSFLRCSKCLRMM